MPFKSANKSLLWYNPTVLEDAGVEPPGRLGRHCRTRAQTIADSGVTPVSVGADVGWPLTDFFENVLLWTAGGEFYDQLANGEASWDSDEVKTALETMAEVWQDDWVVGGLERCGVHRASTESATQLVTEPAGFLFEGDFVAGQITGEEVGEIGTDADFVPFPAIGDGERWRQRDRRGRLPRAAEGLRGRPGADGLPRRAPRPRRSGSPRAGSSRRTPPSTTPCTPTT